MHGEDMDALRGAIAALESQRPNLGDAVLELALAPLRARLAALERPAMLQRRQVTVLFADVVGSSALAQGLDAEDTMAVLTGALQRMAAVVQAHQGRVLRLQRGDGRAMGLDRSVVDVLLRGSAHAWVTAEASTAAALSRKRVACRQRRSHSAPHGALIVKP